MEGSWIKSYYGSATEQLQVSNCYCSYRSVFKLMGSNKHKIIMLAHYLLKLIYYSYGYKPFGVPHFGQLGMYLDTQ